jgi:hypothetical protein
VQHTHAPPCLHYPLFQTHPAVDKNAFKSNILSPKDGATQPFPLNQKRPVVMWKSKKDDDSLAPLTVSCWPSAGSDTTTVCRIGLVAALVFNCSTWQVVNMEYELQHKQRVLTSLMVRIPTPGKVAPVVNHAGVCVFLRATVPLHLLSLL